MINDHWWTVNLRQNEHKESFVQARDVTPNAPGGRQPAHEQHLLLLSSPLSAGGRNRTNTKTSLQLGNYGDTSLQTLTNQTQQNSWTFCRTDLFFFVLLLFFLFRQQLSAGCFPLVDY
jgi:hypothetical protein